MRKSSLLVISFLILSVSIQSIAVQINEFFPDERNAMMQLRDTVNSTSNLHGNWTGPPCTKTNQSRWAGVTCLNWHITHLVLEGIQLTGSLPPWFLLNLTFLSKLSFRDNFLHGPLPDLTNLTNLELVLLSGNQFSGSIPINYIYLPKLAQLELQENDLSGAVPSFDQESLVSFNVSFNQLEGPIPETHVLQRFSKSSFDNNSALCGEGFPGMSPCPISSPPPSPSPVPSRDESGTTRLELWSIALIASAAVLVPLSVVLIFLCCYRRLYGKQTKQDKELAGEVSIDHRGKAHHWSDTDDPERTLELEFLDKPLFDLDDLLRSAAQVLGMGKLGTTYVAMLDCGSVVAVKRLKETNALSKKDFAQQLHLLGRMKHENLVDIISFYQSKEEKLIIYDYVPDGSLFALLHENRGVGRTPLSWNKRVSIIKDIAQGLDYLHRFLTSQRVPHGNLKSSNVLIQHENHPNVTIHAKLTDYGYLPIVPTNKLTVKSTPEFAKGRKLSHKADVYCFGVLVLEIVTGRVPMPSSSPVNGREEDEDLSSWVRSAVSNDWSTDILDVEILAERDGYDDMLKLTEIALECTDELPERRPNMSEVLIRIQDMMSTAT